MKAPSSAAFGSAVRNGNDRARHVYSALGFEDVGPEEGDPGSRTMLLTKAAWSAARPPDQGAEKAIRLRP